MSRSTASNVMLDLSIETPMQGAAYNDQRNDSNTDGDTNDLNECSGRVNDGGTVGRCYFATQEYLGIFDPKKAYDYSGGRFVPVAATNADHSTSGHYSGNFLNWATMTAIDEFRWALTGGRRVTDTTAETVTQRANMLLNRGNDWYPVKMISDTTNANVAPNTVTPFANTKIYIYNHGTQVDINTKWDGTGIALAANLNVSVKVCDPTKGLEGNCVGYANGTYYKPEGLIQNNADRMRFAVMSYALDNDQSRGGGVLRSNMKYVGPTLPDGTANPKKEYGTDGLSILITNPESAIEGNSGVINFVNKFGAGGYKSYDPAGELFYECLNFFKNRGPTPEYVSGLSLAQKENFPALTTWEDPVKDWCQPNYIVGINDANPWLDKKLPGTYFMSDKFHGVSLIGSDYGEPGNADTAINVRNLTNTVGDLEGLTNSSNCIGYTDLEWDGSATKITNLGEVMGTCPYTGKQNSYYIAGMAYYAHTQDIRSDLNGKQTISTFMIDTQEYSGTPLVGKTNMLWLTGKYGGFKENDHPDPKNLNPTNTGNQLQPNLTSEWDADGDGTPDNYVLATDPVKLITGLTKVFSDISKQTSSGTAASVISGSRSGEGAIYQSVFYPEYGDDSIADNKITWAGSVHASFVDDLGRMREDTNQNRILDENDKVIVFRKDGENLVIDKYGLVGAVAEVTKVTLPVPALLAGKYFRLNAVGEEFYVWFTVDGNGSNPLLHGMSGIPVALLSTDLAGDVATKTAAAIDTYGAFAVLHVPGAAFITITNTLPGVVDHATLGTTSGVPGVGISVTQQGIGETTHLDFSGNAEDIKYLWNSNTWLNSISDADIVTQRTPYNDSAHQRYIFTFIDKNKNKIVDSDEQLAFSATALPSPANLTNDATIYPYIPVYSDSTTLPVWVDTTDPTDPILLDFLKYQTQRVVNYTRGLDQGSTAITGGTLPAFRSRKLDLDNNGSLETTWRLGDIVNSSPTVVNKPREALHLLYKDATYATFAAKYGNRRTVLYTGANDGMLHAFNGGFYEDRFDVFPGSIAPAVPDGIKDVEYLLQPKKITSAVGVTPVVWGPDTSFTARPLGAELWAYVPYNLLPHLYWPTEPDYAHVYYADLKPRIFDAKIFTPDADHPGGWGTVLVGGMRLGGGKINVDMNRLNGNVNSADRTMTSAYYILDITNPEVAPTVLAEINFPELGYTTCYPTVATIKDKIEVAGSPNRWFLIFGSGPADFIITAGTTTGWNASSNFVSNQKAKIYVVDLEEMVKNKVLKTLNTDGALTAASPYYFQSFDSDKNAFISDPITVDYDLDYKADAVYFGTQSYDVAAAVGTKWGGKLRRIVIDDDADPTQWEGDSVLIDLESSRHQPITAAPSVGLDPDGNDWIFFGTGRYFIRDDKDITTQQTFYGIKEPRNAVAPYGNTYAEVFLTATAMYDSTSIEVNATTGLVSGGTAPNTWTNATWPSFLTSTKAFKGGWYFNFIPSLERNVGQAALFGDLLTFTSYVPSNDICTYEGSSYLYALYYLTGTAPSRGAIHDSTNPTNYLKRVSLGTGLVTKPSIHVGRKDGSTIFVQTSEGAILTLDEENPGQSHSGRTSWGYK
ncbi:MAG: hypothetical protein JZU65_15390 [Chlorobium sp.]|nr:hypothetical protein [Chlorobium sp.]